MEIYFRGVFYKHAENLEDAERLICEYQQDSFVEYQKFKAIYESCNKAIEKIRRKGNIETNLEYLEYIKTNHSEVLTSVRTLGEMVLKEGFNEVYFFNADETSIGYRQDAKAIPLSLLPLKAALAFPKRDEFEIR